MIKNVHFETYVRPKEALIACWQSPISELLMFPHCKDQDILGQHDSTPQFHTSTFAAGTKNTNPSKPNNNHLGKLSLNLYKTQFLKALSKPNIISKPNFGFGWYKKKLFWKKYENLPQLITLFIIPRCALTSCSPLWVCLQSGAAPGWDGLIHPFRFGSGRETLCAINICLHTSSVLFHTNIWTKKMCRK